MGKRVAHDERKEDLLEWVKYNEKKLATHELWATGTTGGVISENCSLEIFSLKYGVVSPDAMALFGLIPSVTLR